MEGWIKLHRKLIDSRVFASPELLKLWILCLCKANHKKTYVPLDGLSEPVEVNSGEFVTGRYALHRDFYPVGSESNKTPITVWRWLLKLEEWGNLIINTNNRYSLIQIVNWDIYQSKKEDEQENDQQMISRRSSDEQQVITDKNDNNDKNGKNCAQPAERIYQAYPRKVGKKKAIKSIRHALKEVDGEHLLERVELFANCVKGQSAKFIPYPATWFNQGRWEDDPVEWKAWKKNNEDKPGVNDWDQQHLKNRAYQEL